MEHTIKKKQNFWLIVYRYYFELQYSFIPKQDYIWALLNFINEKQNATTDAKFVERILSVLEYQCVFVCSFGHLRNSKR